jgi:ATP-dependent Lon protease
MIKIPKLFNQNGSQEEKVHLPLVPLRDMVLFPFITTSVFVGRLCPMPWQKIKRFF